MLIPEHVAPLSSPIHISVRPLAPRKSPRHMESTDEPGDEPLFRSAGFPSLSLSQVNNTPDYWLRPRPFSHDNKRFTSSLDPRALTASLRQSINELANEEENEGDDSADSPISDVGFLTDADSTTPPRIRVSQCQAQDDDYTEDHDDEPNMHSSSFDPEQLRSIVRTIASEQSLEETTEAPMEQEKSAPTSPRDPSSESVDENAEESEDVDIGQEANGVTNQAQEEDIQTVEATELDDHNNHNNEGEDAIASMNNSRHIEEHDESTNRSERLSYSREETLKHMRLLAVEREQLLQDLEKLRLKENVIIRQLHENQARAQSFLDSHDALSHKY